MTSINYDDVFSYFLGNIKDFEIASLSNDIANELMVEYLHKTLGDVSIAKLFSSITLDDLSGVIEYQMRTAWENDDEFVKSMLAKAMVCEWLRPLVRSKTNTAQLLGGKDEKFYSQAQHLDKLRALLHDVEKELKSFIRNRLYVSDVYSNGI